ncbi:MAG: hypothetical protein ACTTH7_01020 [Treponema sp.]
MKEYFHRIISGYRALIFKICSFILIFAICLGVSFVIVYPLWFLAVYHAAAYTIIALLLLAGTVSYLAVKRQIKKYKQNRRRFFHTLVKRCVILIGLIACIISLMYFNRIITFLILVLSVLVYGFAAFGRSQDSF